MQSKRVQGQLALRGLFGRAWVYISASQAGGGLRVVNVPAWCSADHVRQAFTEYAGDDDAGRALGEVCVVTGRGGVRMATVALGAKGVKAVLKAPARHLRAVEAPPPADVVAGWARRYEEARRVERVQGWADATMEAHDAREREAEEKRQRQREQGVDDDGFALVVDGAPVRKASEQEMMELDGRKVAFKQGSAAPEGFYRWQRRKRQADIEGLRERFEQDKKRLRAAAALKLVGDGKQ